MLTGIFIILLFFALGEALAWLTGGFIPGSVLGMILLFSALCMKIVKPEQVKPVARFLCDNMALFFVPAGVGIINALDILSRYWQAVLVSCAVSTVLVIIVVAGLQQWQENRKEAKTTASPTNAGTGTKEATPERPATVPCRAENNTASDLKHKPL